MSAGKYYKKIVHEQNVVLYGIKTSYRKAFYELNLSIESVELSLDPSLQKNILKNSEKKKILVVVHKKCPCFFYL